MGNSRHPASVQNTRRSVPTNDDPDFFGSRCCRLPVRPAPPLRIRLRHTRLGRAAPRRDAQPLRHIHRRREPAARAAREAAEENIAAARRIDPARRRRIPRPNSPAICCCGCDAADPAEGRSGGGNRHHRGRKRLRRHSPNAGTKSSSRIEPHHVDIAAGTHGDRRDRRVARIRKIHGNRKKRLRSGCGERERQCQRHPHYRSPAPVSKSVHLWQMSAWQPDRKLPGRS